MPRRVTFSKAPEMIRRRALDPFHRGEEMGPDPLLQPCCRLRVDGSINLRGMERLTIIIFINQPDGQASLSVPSPP